MFTFTRTTGGNPAAALIDLLHDQRHGDERRRLQRHRRPSSSSPRTRRAPRSTITPFADNLVEGAETMTVTINPNNTYTIGAPNAAAITIADSVTTVNMTATDAAASEPGTDTATFTFTRTTDGNPAAALSVFYTIGGTATNGNDYSATGDRSWSFPRIRRAPR